MGSHCCTLFQTLHNWTCLLFSTSQFLNRFQQALYLSIALSGRARVCLPSFDSRVRKEVHLYRGPAIVRRLWLSFVSVFNNCSLYIQSIFTMSAPTSGYSAEYLAENKAVNILVPMWTLTVIVTSMVVARVYIRVKIVKNLGLDDWVIMAGMVSNFTMKRIVEYTNLLDSRAHLSRLNHCECHGWVWKACCRIGSSSLWEGCLT